MRKQLQDRAQHAVALAKKAGANDVFASASRSRNVSYELRNGKLEQVKDSTSRSLSLRLFVDGRYSEHSTTDLRPDRLGRFVTETVALTRALQPDKYRVITDPALFKGRSGKDLRLVDKAVQGLDRDKRLRWCKEMNDRVAGKDKVVSASSSMWDGTVIAAAASSNGFAGDYAASNVGMFSSATMKGSDGSRPEDYMYARARHLADLPKPAAIADEALRRARGRLGTTKGPTAKTTMVVDRMAAGRLLRRLLGPASGRLIQQSRSFWAGKLGQKHVSELLSIVDDPLIPGGLGSRPFDSEGIAARQMPVIDKGVLKSYFLDTYYAKKLGMNPTTGGPSNLVVTLGAQDRDAIVASADKGIYVVSWLGGNMDSTTGDFSFGVRGNIIEGGKLGAPVGEMNVTGNIAKLFSQLVSVGNDPWMSSSIRSPTLAFSDVQFSGK